MSSKLGRFIKESRKAYKFAHYQFLNFLAEKGRRNFQLLYAYQPQIYRAIHYILWLKDHLIFFYNFQLIVV